jgi:hypothetical protein
LQKVSRARYDPKIIFEDPISRYTDIDGYCFNISLLTTVFDIRFDLHDVAITASDRISSRWSMELQFKFLPFLPWKPKAIITGTSDYGVDLTSGLIISHVDKWDAVENNQFLSIEGLQYTLKSFAEVFSNSSNLDCSFTSTSVQVVTCDFRDPLVQYCGSTQCFCHSYLAGISPTYHIGSIYSNNQLYSRVGHSLFSPFPVSRSTS